MAWDDGTCELKRALTDPNSGGVKGALSEYDDIISEILFRLPIKSLVRFRCVCKHWRSLIAAPYFVKKQLERGISQLLFSMDPPKALNCKALKNLDLEEVEVDVHFAIRELDFHVTIPNYSSKGIAVVGSCNGLVCLSVHFKGIVVWNPSTRESSKVLPNPPYGKFYPYCCFYGFGYDSKADDYKIVIARGTETHIFALKSGSWKTVPLVMAIPNLNDDDVYFVGHGRFLNGALHWFAHAGPRPAVVSFILEKERFQEMVPLPSGDLDKFTDLLIFRSCLSLVQLLDRPDYSSIWIMKEYGVAESWTQVVQFSIDSSSLSQQAPMVSPQHFWTPLCILENGVILMQKRVYENSSRRNILMLINKTTSKTVFEVAGDMRFGSAIYEETSASVGSLPGLQY